MCLCNSCCFFYNCFYLLLIQRMELLRRRIIIKIWKSKESKVCQIYLVDISHYCATWHDMTLKSFQIFCRVLGLSLIVSMLHSGVWDGILSWRGFETNSFPTVCVNYNAWINCIWATRGRNYWRNSAHCSIQCHKIFNQNNFTISFMWEKH